MAIGILGPITFNSSSDKVQTFQEFNLDKTSRISVHENMQTKPIAEFIGPGLDKITLKLTWSIEGKINPDKEIKKLEDKQEKGEVIIFFLGGKPVGKGKYLIESISKANKRIDNKGNLLSISFDVNLMEYAENARKETRIVKRSPVKTVSKTTPTTKKSNKNTKVKKKSSTKPKVKKKVTTKKTKKTNVYAKKTNVYTKKDTKSIPMPKVGTNLMDLMKDLNSFKKAKTPIKKGGGTR